MVERTMASDHILILGDHNHHALAAVISSLGFSPVVWSSALHSLEKLRTSHVNAVVIDRDVTHTDVLEFILNVQDIDHSMPIIVIGKRKHDHTDQAICEQDRVTYIQTTSTDPELSATLFHLLKA